MPGNEVRDQIHNFFGQDNLSQGQRHSQVVDGTWPGLTNNPWAGSQRQIGAPLISNLKNNSVQQPVDSERGHGGQPSNVRHGLNFAHSNPGPEFARSQAHSQQPALNGYMLGHQVFQTRQREANFLGMDTESDGQNVASQLPNGHELKKNSARMGFPDSHVNYDFFGTQQPISSQHPGMLQSLSKQQSGASDMQLVQQQLILKQMQELQRQQQLQKQQLQHQEAVPLNSINQINAFAKQAAAGHSPALINGFPVHDTSNYSWQHEVLAANTNWLQHGSSPVMQGSFSAQMLSPEQSQTPHLIGMPPQHVDQSLYGAPISGTRVTPSQFSPIQMDKPTMQQTPGGNSILGNQFTGFSHEGSMQDGSLVARQGYQGKNMTRTADGQGLNGEFNLENLQQVNPRHSNASMQEFLVRQEVPGPSETVEEKTVIQVNPPKNMATLDPTEERILFGSDDNLWDAFGKGTNMGSGGYNILDGADVFSSIPSMQSGSWSALMQSAVAETSSNDVGIQEEWSGLAFQNSEPAAGNQRAVIDSGKRHLAWADNSLKNSSQNSRHFPLSDDTNTRMNYIVPAVQQYAVSTLQEQSERLQTGSPQRSIQQFPVDGAKWLDRSLLQKPISESTHAGGEVTHSSDAESIIKSTSGSWTNQQSLPSYNTGSQPCGRPNVWKFNDSVSPSMSVALKKQENENSLRASQRVDQKSPLSEEMSHGSGLWKSDSVSDSIPELGHAKNRQVNEDGSSQNNGALLDSKVVKVDHDSSQHLPNSNNIDIWKHVGSSVNPCGSEIPGKHESYLGERHLNFESSGKNSLGNGAVKAHERLNKNVKENAPDSNHNVQSLPSSCEASQRQLWPSISDPSGLASSSTQGNVSSAFPHGFPYSTGHFQKQHMADAGGQATTNHSSDLSLSRFATQSKQMESFERAKANQLVLASPQDTSGSMPHSDMGSSREMSQSSICNQNPSVDSAQQFPVLEASKMSATVWTSESTQQRPFSARPFRVPPSMFRPNSQSNNNLETAFSLPQKLDNLNATTGGSCSAESGPCSMDSHGLIGKEQPAKGNPLLKVSYGNDTAQKTLEASRRNESTVRLDTGTSFSNPAHTQKEIEAFGRSLRPNNSLHKNYSLLQQVQGVKNTEVDPGYRGLKRFKGPDGAVDPHLVGTMGEQQFHGQNSMVRDASTNHSSIPSGDSKMLNFAAKPTDRETNIPPQDMLAFGRNDCQNSVSGEHSHISPQMAPSWFDQYGTFKSGPTLGMYATQKTAILKTSELPLTIEKSDGHAHSSMEQGNAVLADVSQCGVFHRNSTPTTLVTEDVPTQLSHPDAAVLSLVAVRPKKRKNATSELVPWHKEVILGQQRLQDISKAEVDWAQAANRLPEKVEDEAEMVDEGPPVLRSKRRLILTTQLMQLLLCPAMASVLSADAFSHIECAAYFVARSTLGDACSSLCTARSDTPVPSNSKPLPMTVRTSERISDQYFSKFMEDLISRARKVENDLLRLDKKVSVLDLRVECQELEKFSVINRFAKFHGRGQADGAETSSSYDTHANAQKLFPQRYVTALPMPRNLPDMVQCLSL